MLNKKVKGASIDEDEYIPETRIFEANYNQDDVLITAAKKKGKKKSSKRRKRRKINISKFLKIIDYVSLGISFESNIFKGNLYLISLKIMNLLIPFFLL